MPSITPGVALQAEALGLQELAHHYEPDDVALPMELLKYRFHQARTALR